MGSLPSFSRSLSLCGNPPSWFPLLPGRIPLPFAYGNILVFRPSLFLGLCGALVGLFSGSLSLNCFFFTSSHWKKQGRRDEENVADNLQQTFFPLSFLSFLSHRHLVAPSETSTRASVKQHQRRLMRLANRACDVCRRPVKFHLPVAASSNDAIDNGDTPSFGNQSRHLRPGYPPIALGSSRKKPTPKNLKKGRAPHTHTHAHKQRKKNHFLCSHDLHLGVSNELDRRPVWWWSSRCIPAQVRGGPQVSGPQPTDTDTVVTGRLGLATITINRASLSSSSSSSSSSLPK